MSETIVKNVVINTIGESEQFDIRLEAIQHVLDTTPLADKISLRIYRAQEDRTIVVEKWTFADDETRKIFTESDGIALGPWPQASQDHALGPLTLNSENVWEE